MTFPEHGKAARDAAGWHVCLERLVMSATATASASTCPRSQPSAGGSSTAGYVERLGPEASAVGPPREWEQVHGADGRLTSATGVNAGRIEAKKVDHNP